MVDKWTKIWEELAQTGHQIRWKSHYKGTVRGSLMEQINRQYPTYLVNLYCYTTSIFQQLGDAMNIKANIDQVALAFYISVGQLKQCFRCMKGKLLSPSKKPHCTPDHLTVQIAYAVWISQKQQEGRHICCKDKTCFCTTSCWKKNWNRYLSSNMKS